MRQHSGMLVERGQNAFGFRHLTFQEYFAGRALARLGQAARWAVLTEPKENLHSGRWREPLLLCAARLGVSENRADEATALVEQVLDAASEYEHLLHRDLFLAADCATDDLGLRVSLLQRITDALWPLLDSPIPAVEKGVLRRLTRLALLRAGEGARMPELVGRVREKLLEGAMAPFRHPNDQGRQVAQELLRRMAQVDQESRTTFQNHLADNNPGMRQAAVQALAPLAPTDPALRNSLLQRLTDDNSDVRAAAIFALSPLIRSDPSLEARFLPVVGYADAQVYSATPPFHDIRRALAAEYGALVRDDPARRAKIVDLLGHVDWRMRLAAVEILDAAGEDAVREALPQLLIALEDERGLDSWPTRLTAAALLLNDDRQGEQALNITLEALTYGADTLFTIPGAAAVRKQAALTLGKLRALHHRRDVAAVIGGLLGSETDPQVLDGLYEAVGALAGEPEAQG